MKTWNIEQLTGYKPMTTFYEDFSIADIFGVSAVKDTYKRAFKEWKSDYKYLTELIMVLNWKIFEHYNRNDALAELYDTLFKEADEWAYNNLKDEALHYYLVTTD